MRPKTGDNSELRRKKISCGRILNKDLKNNVVVDIKNVDIPNRSNILNNTNISNS